MVFISASNNWVNTISFYIFKDNLIKWNRTFWGKGWANSTGGGISLYDECVFFFIFTIWFQIRTSDLLFLF